MISEVALLSLVPSNLAQGYFCLNVHSYISDGSSVLNSSSLENNNRILGSAENLKYDNDCDHRFTIVIYDE
jgi:hypothetical protein